MSNVNRVLVLFAHPALEKSWVNRQLIQAIEGVESITIHDLYERYPTFQIDVKYEQSLLLEHDIIVFQHPFYWYSSPAILKEWQDLVLEYGFAYGEDGKALKGKKFLSAITTGGSKQAYCRHGHNYFTIRELLAPFEQTARLCSMEYLPPFVIQGTHQLREPEHIAKHTEDYRTVLLALRDDTIHWDQLHQLTHFNHNLKQVISSSEISHHAQ
jgi:glutathione-regulated potassium-efflux system ancillary protein KefG